MDYNSNYNVLHLLLTLKTVFLGNTTILHFNGCQPYTAACIFNHLMLKYS